jgi:hypothetical protein
MFRCLLNIASIVCLVLCVALTGMWVRSYWLVDNILISSGSRSFFIVSGWGKAVYELTDASGQSRFDCTWISRPQPPNHPRPSLLSFYFQWHFPAQVGLPYWFVVTVCGLLAMLCRPRWPWRFTLRTLFIAVTFLAVVMGMIAWLDRAWIGK